MGVLIEKENISLTSSVEIKNDNNEVIGDLRSGCYSPHFKKAIGIAMINEPNCKPSTKGIIKIDDKSYGVSICELPFI
jgi:dimethylsulfoniopropionate demethylase